MKAITNFIFISIMLFGLTSCNSEVNDLAENKVPENVENISMECVEFSNSLKIAVDAFNKDTALLNKLFQYDYEISTRGTAGITHEEETKANEITNRLLTPSENLLSSFNIKDVQELSNEEKIALSILLYADFMDNSFKTRGGDLTGNHYPDCALTALGIADLSDILKNGLSNYAKKKGGKALLKTIAKVAGKNLSYIGWGLTAYDFATCI